METKPAIYTTEFWFSLLTALGVLVNWAGLWDWASNWHSGIVGAIVLAAYNFARGQAKQGVPADPAVPGNYTLIPRQRDMLHRGK